jgi:hypothetical protein
MTDHHPHAKGAPMAQWRGCLLQYPGFKTTHFAHDMASVALCGLGTEDMRETGDFGDPKCRDCQKAYDREVDAKLGISPDQPHRFAVCLGQADAALIIIGIQASSALDFATTKQGLRDALKGINQTALEAQAKIAAMLDSDETPAETPEPDKPATLCQAIGVHFMLGDTPDAECQSCGRTRREIEADRIL